MTMIFIVQYIDGGFYESSKHDILGVFDDEEVAEDFKDQLNLSKGHKKGDDWEFYVESYELNQKGVLE